MKKLNFICIGAQKAGTTALTKILSQHEKINFPPIKELHYFSNLKKYPSTDFTRLSFFEKLLNESRRVKKLLILIIIHLFKMNYKEFLFLIKYTFLPLNNRRYLLFLKKNLVNGEITPAYFMLKQAEIDKMKKINPNLKIIILLRHPVQRTVSSFYQKYRHNPKLHTLKNFRTFLVSDFNLLRQSYKDTIDLYKKNFHNVLILSNKQLLNDKINSFNKILTFLEIKMTQDFEKILKKEVIYNETKFIKNPKFFLLADEMLHESKKEYKQIINQYNLK